MLNQEFITALIGLREFAVVDGRIAEDGSVLLQVELKWERARCPHCAAWGGSVVEYLARDQGEFKITCHSANPVLLNGEEKIRTGASAELKVGDKIGICSYELVIQ